MNLNSEQHTSRKLSYDEYNVDIKVDIVYINESVHSCSLNSIIIYRTLREMCSFSLCD